jgi:hypothetical protein
MFRFTIRELVLVVVVIGMGLGLWIAHGENARLRAENTYLLRVKEEAIEWKRSAHEQSLRANFVSDQLHDKLRLHRECPQCGTLVQFPPLKGRPWTAPDDSIWRRDSLLP